MSEAALHRLVTPPQMVEYPERADQMLGKAEEVLQAALATAAAPLRRWRGRRLHRIVSPVNAAAADMARRSSPELVAEFRNVGRALRRSDLGDERAVARALALTREMAHRVLGQRAYDVQIIGAFALLRGTVAEMKTGEGKTLAAALACAVAGCAGVPVHVVTVNDYLARRDAEAMGPFYRSLGLSVGLVIAGQATEERQAAYRCSITYCTDKELAFDYLRDRMAFGQQSGNNLSLKLAALEPGAGRSDKLRLRGLHFAIVDEADSVLIDEARTPLIISGQAGSTLDEPRIGQALEIASVLEEGKDFVLVHGERRVDLTTNGRAQVAARLGEEEGPFRSAIIREEFVRQALTALHVFKRDEDYLVRDDKAMVIDEFTGRVMPDRSWSDGLHQMIEAKEGLPLTLPRATIARMTYQRFFRRYRRLAGMTGTASPAAAEFWSIYRLAVSPIPTNRATIRKGLEDRVFGDEAGKRQALVARVGDLHRRGCPVLIGTRSVIASDSVSAWLADAGLDHVVLSAAQDANEAMIVAQAGERGRITVVTNMAGRGTDIKLGPGMAEVGGLHVIMTERHEARRIDDQLAGRAGRQGEPGSCEAVLSLDDPLLTGDASTGVGSLPRLAFALFGEPAGRAMLRLAQRRAERLHARMRRDLFRSDQQLNRMLSFSGRPE